MIWTHYGRWDDEGLRVLNQYGEVIYESAEAVKLRKAQVLRSQGMPLPGHQNQVPQNGLEGWVNEGGQGVRAG